MSIIMQSSTAAGAATLVALNAGSLTFEQGCAMIVGQSVGTATTTGLVMVGGGLAVRRSALAHDASVKGTGTESSRQKVDPQADQKRDGRRAFASSTGYFPCLRQSRLHDLDALSCR